MSLDAETKFTVAEIAEAAVHAHLVAQDKFLEAKLGEVEAKLSGGLDALGAKIKLWGLSILAGQIIVGLTALGVSHATDTPIRGVAQLTAQAVTGLLL